MRSELLKRAQTLQDFAYAIEDHNRYIGSPSHNATVNCLVETIAPTRYYDIKVQPFTVPSASADLSVNGVNYTVSPMTFTATGTPSGSLVAIANLGCDAVGQQCISLTFCLDAK